MHKAMQQKKETLRQFSTLGLLAALCERFYLESETFFLTDR
jgi:hypothetical protein